MKLTGTNRQMDHVLSQADSLTKNARQYMRRMAEVRVKDIKNKKYLLVFKYSLATYTQFYILDSCLNWGPIFSHVLIIDTFPTYYPDSW